MGMFQSSIKTEDPKFITNCFKQKIDEFCHTLNLVVGVILISDIMEIIYDFALDDYEGFFLRTLQPDIVFNISASYQYLTSQKRFVSMGLGQRGFVDVNVCGSKLGISADDVEYQIFGEEGKFSKSIELANSFLPYYRRVYQKSLFSQAAKELRSSFKEQIQQTSVY